MREIIEKCKKLGILDHGAIIITVLGGIFKINSTSCNIIDGELSIFDNDTKLHNLLYKDNNYSRKATKEEEEAYNQGIRNISEISSKITKLEEGKYYYVNWMYNDTKYIFKYINNHEDKCINLSSNTYYNNGSFNSPQGWKEIRFATKEEQNWLDRCINTDKFVPKEEIKKSLVGRYLKASVDNVQGTSMKKGEFLKITKENFNGGSGESTSSKYEWTHSYIKEGKWELMPEEFIPEQEKKYAGEVVHCKTQEEWDFVNSKLESHLKLPSSTWSSYKERQAKSLGGGQHCSVDWYNDNNYKVYSFEEWCTKFGHKMETKIPEYVECIASNDAPRNWTVGKVYKTEHTGIIADCGYNYKKSSYAEFIEYIAKWDVKFKPSTKEAFDKQNPSNLVCGVNLIPGEVYSFTSSSNWLLKFERIEDDHLVGGSVALPKTNLIGMWYRSQKWGLISTIKDLRLATPEEKAHFEACEKAGGYVDAPKKEESIFEQAKKRYPIGSRVESLVPGYIDEIDHINVYPNTTSELWFRGKNSNIKVYENGRWAKIVQEKWIPKIGDWAKCIGDSAGAGAGWGRDRVFQITKITGSSQDPILWGEGGTLTGPGGVYLKDGNIRKAEPHEIPSYPGTSTGTAKITIKAEDMPTQSHTLSHPWPVGTRVRINPKSEFNYQSKGGSGTIRENNRDREFLYEVKWDEDVSNCYRPEDLLLENTLLNGYSGTITGLVKEMVDFSNKPKESKKHRFDEKEYISNPYNQILKIDRKIKVKKQKPILL